jgi:hypothetical protein
MWLYLTAWFMLIKPMLNTDVGVYRTGIDWLVGAAGSERPAGHRRCGCRRLGGISHAAHRCHALDAHLGRAGGAGAGAAWSGSAWSAS